MQRAGHCVFELCTSEQPGSTMDVADSGQITRLTIPKSVGKDAWVDCKSRSWGKVKARRSEGPACPSWCTETTRISPPAGWSQKYVPSFMPSRCPFTGDVLPQYSKSYRAAMPKDDDGEQVDKQEFKD